MVINRASSYAISKDEKVFLIHGFLGAHWNLHYHERCLKKALIDTLAWDYSSRDKTIQEHAIDLCEALRQEASQHKGRRIHFVTHSMGGLVLRAALNHPNCPSEAKWGRAVLLVPPNKGAILGRKLGVWKVISALCKDKSGRELLTQMDFDYLGEFPSTMRVKIIAGDLNVNPLLPSASDGVVTVEETFLQTMHERAVLHEDHHTILLSKAAHQLILEFLLHNE